MPPDEKNPFQNNPFQSFMEHIPSPLCCYDRQGKIVHSNIQFEHLLERARHDIKGQDFFKILNPERVNPRMRAVLLSVFSGKKSADIKLKASSFHGEVRHLALSVFPVFNHLNKISFGAVLVTDLTEKKSLEQALLHTEKMAALGTLATGLAHEVGTPMNIILGRAESLLKHTKEEKTAKGLTIIIEQIDRMTHLIERLLAFARRNPILREPVQMNTLIQKGIEIIDTRALRENVAITAKLDPLLPLIWGDGEQLLQVVINLLMNALDATDEGGEILVKTYIFPSASGSSQKVTPLHRIKKGIRILFKDTGDGIATVHLDKIFDPFFTTKPAGKGTGLGLAVVQGIIREHGGEIEVNSTPGDGTVFLLSIPEGPPGERITFNN